MICAIGLPVARVQFGTEIAIVAVIGVLAIVLTLVMKSVNQKRDAEIRSFAQRIGFRYLGTDRTGLEANLVDFYPFGRGAGQRVRNRLSGRRGTIDFELFDFLFEQAGFSHDGDRDTMEVSVVVATAPVSLPHVTFTPETFFLRVGKAAGLQDIDFESDEFNRKYRVAAEDRRGAFDLLHPQMIDYLLKHPVRFWQVRGHSIVIVTVDSNPVTMHQVMTEIQDFVSLVPAWMRLADADPPGSR